MEGNEDGGNADDIPGIPGVESEEGPFVDPAFQNEISQMFLNNGGTVTSPANNHNLHANNAGGRLGVLTGVVTAVGLSGAPVAGGAPAPPYCCCSSCCCC